MAGFDGDGVDDDDDSGGNDNDGQLDVAISGGSMGGLFTALALGDADRPIDVDVFERSAGELKGRGAGIVAQLAMLDFLDAHDIARPEELTTTTATRQHIDRSGGPSTRTTSPTIWAARRSASVGATTRPERTAAGTGAETMGRRRSDSRTARRSGPTSP